MAKNTPRYSLNNQVIFHENNTVNACAFITVLFEVVYLNKSIKHNWK